MTTTNHDMMDELESALGYRFIDRCLLMEALTHRSFLNESCNAGVRDNERLEFFGDAVLGFFISRELLARFPELKEGELTRLRASLVDRESLARFASALRLGRYLRVGRGEERSGGREKRSILADACEALLGALYLDGGEAPVRRLLLGHFAPFLETEGRGMTRDYKTELQELVQARYGATPSYEVAAAAGPDHERRFTVAVMVEGRRLSTGSGGSKKEAEQAAAEILLGQLLAAELKS